MHPAISRHTVVCQWPRKQKKTLHTSVLFTGTASCQIQPSVSPKFLSQFLPNLYIFCLTYTQLHILKLKEIALAVLETFVPKNCPIFFTFFFYKITNTFKLYKNNLPMFQIWNTYNAHWGLHFPKILRNSNKDWGSYVL